MPKKVGVNSKAEEARERKGQAAAAKKEKEEREKADAAWQDDCKQSKAAKKKEEESKRKQEAAASKAAAKKLAEEEEREMEKVAKKAGGGAGKGKSAGGAVGKVTQAELVRMKEKEMKEREEEAEKARRRERRVADESDYAKMVDVQNRNREDGVVDARSVDEALGLLTVADEAVLDKHPEKRLKASYKAFEEAELAKLKAERPGMTLTQYKELIWKLWKKSPQNPLNQQ